MYGTTKKEPTMKGVIVNIEKRKMFLFDFNFASWSKAIMPENPKNMNVIKPRYFITTTNQFET